MLVGLIVVDIEKIEERKLIYVSSTRAYFKLFLHYQNETNSLILKDILSILNNKKV